jgi:SAM-dependent methyltransferase
VNKEEYQNMFGLEDTHWWYLGQRDIVLHMLSKSGLDIEHSKISLLDAGCGTGGMLGYLRDSGSRTDAWGFDFSEDALAFCQQRDLDRLARGSVTDVPFASGSFDLIISFDVLCHKSIPDYMVALKEFRRLLKPGGRLLLRLPAYNWLRGSHDVEVHTIRRFSAPEIRQKLGQAGFRVERVTYANTILFPVAAGKRIAQMITGLGSSSDVQPVAPVINRALSGVLSLEAKILSKTDLPWGLSVYGLGRAP